MTRHDDDQRPTVKVTDRRRHREDRAAPAEAGAADAEAREDAEATAPEETPAADVTAATAPAGDASDSGSDLATARQEAAEYLDHLRRLQADFDNFRKRTLKQQTNAVELAARPIVARLLEVLDDFDLALMAAEQQPDFEKFRKGVELVYAKLADVLRAEGVKRIDAEGAPFDPELHEALMQTGEGDGELVVADVLRPGYTLKGRVLRPAGVRVHKE
jgi:molecular chaperone GrpE